MNVEGDMDLGSHDLAAENIYSDSYVKTKYLEATTGAISNQIGVTSDLAMLNNKKLKVDLIGKSSENKITVYDNLNVLGTLTVAGNVQTWGYHII